MKEKLQLPRSTAVVDSRARIASRIRTPRWFGMFVGTVIDINNQQKKYKADVPQLANRKERTMFLGGQFVAQVEERLARENAELAKPSRRRRARDIRHQALILQMERDVQRRLNRVKTDDEAQKMLSAYTQGKDFVHSHPQVTFSELING